MIDNNLHYIYERCCYVIFTFIKILLDKVNGEITTKRNISIKIRVEVVDKKDQTLKIALVDTRFGAHF